MNQIHPDILALVEAMNQNNSQQSFTAYKGVEITETRRKYHLLNHVLTNEQRSGLFLIHIDTLDVHKSLGYGKAGHKIGTVASLLADYTSTNNMNAMLLRGRELGKAAFCAGRECVPAMDPTLREVVQEIEANGTKAVSLLLRGWLEGWKKANLDTPLVKTVKGFGVYQGGRQ
jgi:hypothetical protein